LVHPATDNLAEKDKIVAWAGQCWDALQPFVDPAVYVNALEDAAEGRVREAYGMNYARLAVLKEKYAPANVFRQNSNIKPC
jgi:hypothetical protein